MDGPSFQQVKTVVKAIVLSSSKQITVADLQRDYKYMEGEYIPYESLGYRSLNALLLAMQDAVVLKGHGPNAILAAVVNSKTQHLSELVKGQKGTAEHWRQKQQNNRKNSDSSVQQRLKAWQNNEESCQKAQSSAPRRPALHVTLDPNFDCVENVRIQKCGGLWIPNPKQQNDKSAKSAKSAKPNSSVVECTDVLGQYEQFIEAQKKEQQDEFWASDTSAANDKATAASANINKALPDLATLHLNFAANVVKFGQHIPEYQLSSDLKVEKIISIVLADIHDIYKMWVHIEGDNFAVDTIMNQLKNFFKDVPQKAYCLPIKAIKFGQVCAAIYENHWHRAVILANAKNNRTVVRFVDFGTVDFVHIKDIKYLPQHLAIAPVQAIRAYLTHVRPLEKYWSRETAKYVAALTSNKLLYARISEINEKERALGLVICDTNDDERVIKINQVLIENNFALFDGKWNSQLLPQREQNEAEMYPTFDMLERGKYYTVEQLMSMNEINNNDESTKKLTNSSTNEHEITELAEKFQLL